MKKISNKVKRDENSAEGAHEADNSTIDQDGMQDEGESYVPSGHLIFCNPGGL